MKIDTYDESQEGGGGGWGRAQWESVSSSALLGNVVLGLFWRRTWRSGRLKVRSHQTRMTRINRAIHAKLDAWTFWVYSLHSRMKFTTQQTRICVMGGASARQLQSRCKMYSCFCKSTKMYIQLRVPTYNHNYFVLHCCFGFSASACNDVTARASSWLVCGREYQIFQLARVLKNARTSRFERRR